MTPIAKPESGYFDPARPRGGPQAGGPVVATRELAGPGHGKHGPGQSTAFSGTQAVTPPRRGGWVAVVERAHPSEELAMPRLMKLAALALFALPLAAYAWDRGQAKTFG